ncbi:MAG: HAD hydrolase-like protein [Clostridiales bacterium]|nr:HAD hydrolase-like protein [Clostridiales bacterium]
MKYKLAIFDLDGTLLDTSAGIYNSVRYAERCMGFIPIKNEQLREFVGPPPKLMYMKTYGVDEETAFKAAQKHREYARTKAIYEADLYPGISELLCLLRENGYKLAVATLKGQKIAEKILLNFNLMHFFDIIVGMNESETLTKADTIVEAQKIISKDDRCVLIGDTVYDLNGASELQTDFIAVTYGFGFTRNSNIEYKRLIGIADTPQDIIKIIQNGEI